MNSPSFNSHHHNQLQKSGLDTSMSPNSPYHQGRGLLGMAAGVVTFVLGGCQVGQYIPHYQLEAPALNSHTALAGVQHAQYELNRIVSSGSPIDLKDGVSTSEKIRLMSAYVARRAALSALVLKGDITAANESDEVLHDAQNFVDLGLILNNGSTAPSVGSIPASDFIAPDFSGLAVVSMDDALLAAKVKEWTILANVFSHTMTETDPSPTAAVNAQYLTILGKIFASDLTLASSYRASSSGSIISATLTRSMLSEDAMSGEWMRAWAASEVTKLNPTITKMCEIYSKDAAVILRGDADLATGFATFDFTFESMLPASAVSAWHSAPLEQKLGVFVLMRSMNIEAYTGTQSVAAVTPSADQIRCAAKIVSKK